jgi:FMN phosphatase YigB (HAD superfamily)
LSTPVTWVVFDLGETLIDETANWDCWADYLGVPRFTFHAVFGAVIASGGQHPDVFSYFRSTVDVDFASGPGWSISASDLYDDAIPTLNLLREQGYSLAVLANQPRSAEAFMATLPVDIVATSDEWGVAKPDPRFFERVIEKLGAPAGQIAYVGDRVDNDVLPAKRAGLLAVHLRRGPWGFLQANWPEAAQADLRIDALTELPDALSVARR